MINGISASETDWTEMPSNECEISIPFVLEQKYRLRLIRSTNVFAAGISLNPNGIVVSFAKDQGARRLYLYEGATENDLDHFFQADSQGRAVHTFLKKSFDCTELEGIDHQTFEEAWTICTLCKTLGLDERCPSCGNSNMEGCGVDRCPACKTPVILNSDGQPIGNVCNGYH